MTGKITGALREQSDWEQQDENRLGFIKNKPKNIATVNDINEATAIAKAYTNKTMDFISDTESVTEITWDGNTANRESVLGLGGKYYHISSLTPSFENLEGGSLTITDNSGNENIMEYTQAGYDEERKQIIPYGGAVFICLEDIYESNGTVIKAGVWMGKNEDSGKYVSKLTFGTPMEIRVLKTDEFAQKEIDIADDIPNGLFIGENIYSLFTAGGGSMTYEVGDDTRDTWNVFFNQFEEKRPYTFVLPIISIGAVLKTQQINVNMTKAGVGEIVCTFLSSQNGTMIRIICSLMRIGDTGILLSVVVEPLTIPSIT